ncbi:hypothetical protein Enr10x_41160 [Gimesia panareensis]|uniref:Uncharacterized protein n=1 Tax=Gimesia panareensis TaxID=2527978 RepID=A0A517QAW6_9PLAN|nr:hypothetical protein [Gimesia panareensis]QDT28770.1 hypothetical protein Enr10x_41160 [Gimesia panareensis]
MIQLFHPLLTLIATASDSLLANYVLYLKNENRILRDRAPGEIHTKPHESAQLLKYGKPLGKAINELITIITPGTFHHWVREEKRSREKKTIGRQERVPCCEN